MKNVVVGTAGHIDHGKSALVEALTGSHPDRLEEEKRRGITIDLGFAFLRTPDVSLGFVDVPGHERFVRNMLSGVGGIDLVLFVIAADEGIKPQTREHFDICRMLLIPRGLIALTKADLVDSQTIAAHRVEIQQFLRGSALASAAILPVSARTGAGIETLKASLLELAKSVATKTAEGHPRLPIDRVFAMKGFGTVVTGTLVSGRISVGDELEALPGSRRLRVRGIQSGGESAPSAAAGQRTALNLASTSVEELNRGVVLTAPGLFSATKRIDVSFELLRSHPRALKQRTQIHFHQGTAETAGELILLGRQQLPPGGASLAQIELRDEIFVLPGDRFIIRQFSPVITIGGGVVLDAGARRHKSKDQAVLDYLAIAHRGDRESFLIALLDSEPDALDQPAIIGRTGWTSGEISRHASALQSGGKVAILKRDPVTYALAGRLKETQDAILAAVENSHRQNPLSEGVSLETLRSSVASGKKLFLAALNALLAAQKLTASGEFIKLAGRSIALEPAEQQARDRIAAAFEKAGLAVPAAADVLGGTSIDAARGQKLLQLLLRDGTLVKIGDGLIFHRNALAQLRAALAERKRTRGARIKVPEFKELTGISRKYAIPLLEYLDRSGVTQRIGDERVIL